MKNIFIKSIIISVTIFFLGSSVYIIDKSKTSTKDKTEYQSKQNEMINITLIKNSAFLQKTEKLISGYLLQMPKKFHL